MTSDAMEVKGAAPSFGPSGVMPDVPLGYKRTEAGVIPEDWGADRFGNLCSVVRGGSPRPIQNYITDSADGINWIKIGDVDVGAKYIDSAVERIVPAGVARSRYVKVGDFLLSNSMSFGRPYILRTEGCVHDGWLVIQDYHAKFDTEYLYYYLSGETVLSQYTRYAAGSSVLNLNKELVSGVRVAVPTITEQLAIAEALSDVDGLLGALDALIAKKRAIKQAAMQQLLTGKIRLPGFSGEWEMKRLGELGRCLRGVSYDPATDLASHDTATTVRLLRANNVEGDELSTTDLQFVERRKVTDSQLMRKDDVLVCTASGSKDVVGKAAQFRVADGYQYTFGAFMGCYRTDREKANPTFAFYLFQTGRYRAHLSVTLAGSSINNLRPADIEAAEFRMPKRAEQDAIATVLSDMDAEIAALQARRHKTRQIKQGMMQQLLTGRVRLVTPEAVA